jgi:uncharacterized protein with HEPN domain
VKDDKLYLIHIAECIAKIESYIEGIDLSTFMTQAIVQDAVLRNLQVLAESTQRLSDDFKLQHHEVEWYKIAGLRNILVHDYLGIDLETVWAVVEKKLPELKGAVRTALRS